MPARYDSIAMIRRLVGFDTTSRESNLALIHWVRDYLAEWSVPSTLVHDPDGRKANLFATIGPKDRGGIMLSGHTDVVPVDGQSWDSDPFDLVEKDGRLFGRGTTDMKSFLAVALALVPEMLARPLATPIHLALSYDEEVGCLGVRRLIDKLAEEPQRPRLCIVGEPSGMAVVAAHKGKRSWRCHVRGLECHSSVPQIGVNAVEYAAEIVARLNRIGRRYRDVGPFDPAFDPPYATVHVGTIKGGTALNIVPKDCRFEFEIRHPAEVDPLAFFAEIERQVRDEIEPEMTKISTETGVDFEFMSELPGLTTAEDHPVVQLAKAASGSNAVGKVSFGTEAGLFQRAGIPTVVCGPGAIEQAHRPNEFIATSQVEACEAFLRRVVDRARTESDR
jgi:acetylornithine deacetylase